MNGHPPFARHKRGQSATTRSVRSLLLGLARHRQAEWVSSPVTVDAFDVTSTTMLVRSHHRATMGSPSMGMANDATARTSPTYASQLGSALLRMMARLVAPKNRADAPPAIVVTSDW